MANTWLPAVILRLRETSSRRSRADGPGTSLVWIPHCRGFWEECRVSVAAVVASVMSPARCAERAFTPPYCVLEPGKRGKRKCLLHSCGYKTLHILYQLYKCCIFFFVWFVCFWFQSFQCRRGFLKHSTPAWCFIPTHQSRLFSLPLIRAEQVRVRKQQKKSQQY